MVTFLEAVALRIGPTIDTTQEALLWMFVHAQAQNFAECLSAYARAALGV